MQGLVTFARCQTNKETGAVYANVIYLPMNSSLDKNDEAGLRGIEVRSDPAPALELIKAIKIAGPVVCELELEPQVFGKNQSLQLRAAKVVAQSDKIGFTPEGIRQRKSA